MKPVTRMEKACVSIARLRKIYSPSGRLSEHYKIIYLINTSVGQELTT